MPQQRLGGARRRHVRIVAALAERVTLYLATVVEHDADSTNESGAALASGARVTLLLGRKILMRLGGLPRTAPTEPTRRAIPRAKHFRAAAVALDSILVRPLDVERTSGEPRVVLLALGAETENHGCYSFVRRKKAPPSRAAPGTRLCCGVTASPAGACPRAAGSLFSMRDLL